MNYEYPHNVLITLFCHTEERGISKIKTIENQDNSSEQELSFLYLHRY